MPLLNITKICLVDSVLDVRARAEWQGALSFFDEGRALRQTDHRQRKRLSCPAVAEGVVPGFRTLPTPRLTPDGVFQRLQNIVPQHAQNHFHAFYSSELGGIVTNPAFMMVHIDDHMVHRGHAVYETIHMIDGYLYRLGDHLDRLRHAASLVGIYFDVPDERIMRIILDTAASSLKLDGTVRIWLSAGRGDMGWSNQTCPESAFYVLVTSEKDWVDRAIPWRVTISPVEPLPEYLAGIWSTSCLQRVLCDTEAQNREFNTGLFVDEEGFVLEGSHTSLAIVTQDNDLVLPDTERRLPNIALERILEMIPEFKAEEDLEMRDVVHRPIRADELERAKEVMLISPEFGVVPVGYVEDKRIDMGEPGDVTLHLGGMLDHDVMDEAGPDSPRHVQVPYGQLTGMRSQLT